MLVQNLVAKISECVDDLGHMLDQIYKFPQKQRQTYFDSIQTMKTKLLALKSNAKQGNINSIVKQYKQICIAINSMKNQLTDCITLQANKQNKDINRGRQNRQTKANHDQAMKLIVEKDEEIEWMKGELYHKEQLIRINYEEIKQITKQCQLLAEENKIIKYDYQQLSQHYEYKKNTLMAIEEEILDLRLRDQERSRQLREAVDELNKSKEELISAYDRLSDYEQLAEINMKKTLAVQENIRKIQKQAQDLNQNYRLKENDNFKKIKEISEMENELKSKNKQIQQLKIRNQDLNHDIQQMEEQIVKLQKNMYQQKTSSNEQRESYKILINKQIQQKQQIIKYCQKIKQQYASVVNKYQQLLNTMNQLQEDYQERNEEVEVFKLNNNKINETNKAQAETIETLTKEHAAINQQNIILKQQVKKSLITNKQMEVNYSKYQDKFRQKIEDNTQIRNQLELQMLKVKEMQKELLIRERTQQLLHEQVADQKIVVIKCQERIRNKNKQIQDLKIRLIKAKIETIHSIRQQII